MARQSYFFEFPILGNLYGDVFAESVWRDFDRLFSAFSGTVGTFPPYNIYALNDGSAKIEFALAGYDQEEIGISAEDGKLIIEGKKQDKKNAEETENSEEDTCRCVRHGIRKSSFRTVLPIESRFDLSRTVARMKNGMLTIIVPLEETRKARKINVLLEGKEKTALPIN